MPMSDCSGQSMVRDVVVEMTREWRDEGRKIDVAGVEQWEPDWFAALLEIREQRQVHQAGDRIPAVAFCRCDEV